MKICVGPFVLLIVLIFTISANSAPTKSDSRISKSLTYFDYIQSNDESEFQNYIGAPEDYPNHHDNDANELSRMIPTKHKVANGKSSFNSPIYYIRLPAQPYMFVPGLGYISQPSQTDAGSMLNLPVNFISNGKPGTIYQWNGGFGKFPTLIKPISQPEVPKSKLQPEPIDSKIHRLPGKYVFNGNPNDVYVLSDSYNLIYEDALHNFYP